MVEEYQEADVSLDTWLCEAALLMHWVHVGSAVAQSTGQLILVKADILIDVIKRHRLVRDFALAYGTVFHEQINNTIHPNALTDLVVPGATFDTLIQRLSWDAKNIVQKAALSRELARTVHRTPYRYALHTLQEEVINGRGLLYVSSKDELRRVVDVTMSCVWSADDKMFLAVLGSIENGQAVVGCRLPAITRTNDEDAEDSLVR